MTRMLAAAALVVTFVAGASAQAPDPSRVRAAFLKLIDRPRVPLEPQAQPRTDSGSHRAEDFSFASEAGERVPGIFLTAYTTIDTVFPAIDAGVERVLAKPVNYRELIPLVEELAGKAD